MIHIHTHNYIQKIVHAGNLKGFTYLLGSGKLIGLPLTMFVKQEQCINHTYLSTKL